ncbi:MAG: hypothetical protein ABSA12_02160 [Verrucomicrobiia bacterium]
MDECSIAYNAYCISRTGADEYGTSRPLYFRGLDVFYDPVDVYSVVLPIRAFGLEKWVARLPSGLYCLLACVAFSMLLRHWRFEPPLALAGGFLLSVIPWVFPLSRGCAYAGHTAALLGLATGLALTGSALRRRSNWRAVLAGVTWALTFYTHQTIQPVLALLIIGCVIVLWRPLVQRWRLVLLMTFSALIILLPLIINILRSPEGLTVRFHQVSITNGATSLRDGMVDVASRYLDYFKPQFLFISGDPEPRHHTGHGGELYWCLAPLILIGLYVAVRCWRQHASSRIILVGILVSPVSAALTMDREHSTRGVSAVIFWLLLAMLGAQWLWQRPGRWRKLLFLIACAGTLEIALYMRDYFGAYQTRDPQALQTELTDAFEYCFAHLETNQILYISASTYTPYGAIVNADLKPQLYVYVLFFGKIDPHIYQRTGLPTGTVRLYDGHAPKPGLLLGCNNYYIRSPDRPNEFLAASDNLPMPLAARLIESIPFSGQYSFAKYQVFGIP